MESLIIKLTYDLKDKIFFCLIFFLFMRDAFFHSTYFTNVSKKITEIKTYRNLERDF